MSQSIERLWVHTTGDLRTSCSNVSAHYSYAAIPCYIVRLELGARVKL